MISRSCPLQIVPSDLYKAVPSAFPSANYRPPPGPLELLGDLLGTRSLVDNSVVQEERLKLASYGLIARNLFKDIVVRQVQGFSHFYSQARDIIDG